MRDGSRWALGIIITVVLGVATFTVGFINGYHGGQADERQRVCLALAVKEPALKVICE